MATSIAHHSQATTLSQTAQSAAASKSFYNQCFENLSPDKISTAKRWSNLYLVAAGVTFVAFTALSAGLFAAAGFLAPLYVPFVGIGALLSALPVVNFVKKFLESSQDCDKQAIKYRSIQQHHNTLTQQGPQNAHLNLIRRGITWFQIPGQALNHPDDIAAIYPILAHAMYLDDKIQEDLQTKERLTNEANTLVGADFTANRQTIYELRTAALFTEQRAMETKVEAAFVNAVLRKANFNGSLEDIASLTRVNYFDRMLGNELNSGAAVNEFLTFKNRNLASITFNEVKTLTVAQLGQRIATAIN
jgi:hypothetical protein